MIRLSYWLAPLAAFVAAMGSVPATNAASVTKQVYVKFDGSLSGSAYTLGVGEIDNSFTFGANGAVSISGGVATVPGDTDRHAGFLFSGADLVTEQSLGSLRTTNWITETLFCPSVAAAAQPQFATNYGNHILDVQGDTFYRYDGFGNNPKIVDFGYYSSGNDTESKQTVPDLPVNKYSHLALVWTASTHTLEAFLNNVSQGSVTTTLPFDASSPNVGYGFFSRFLDRAVQGKLDAVAFSTFTGTFNPSSDFQLSNVPEPGSIVLAAIALVGLALVRRK
jgi:PEP-CTERM motif